MAQPSMLEHGVKPVVGLLGVPPCKLIRGAIIPLVEKDDDQQQDER